MISHAVQHYTLELAVAAGPNDEYPEGYLGTSSLRLRCGTIAIYTTTSLQASVLWAVHYDKTVNH